MMTPVQSAFIGVGAIGRPIARRLLQAGFPLAVFDTRIEAVEALAATGAILAASPRQATESADIVFTCLPNEAAINAVYFGEEGILSGAHRPRFAVDLSTSGPTLAAQVGKCLHAEGVAFVDAPITGGAAKASNGMLTAIVAGRPEAIESVRPALQTFCSRVFAVGTEPGQAQIVKLINNVLSYAALAVTSEALVLGKKAGIEADVVLQALNAGTGRNSATESKIPDNVLSRRFDYGASNRISDKDLTLYLDAADGLRVPTPIASLLFQLLRIWIREHPDDDMTSIARMFEGWSKVELTASTRPNVDA